MTLLSYIDSVVIQDWSGRDVEFREATSIEKFAEIACMSRRNLQLVFKAYIHETIGSYKSRIRMEYAQQIMKTDNVKVADISDMVGFANVSAFNNEFRKMYNQSPLERREELISSMSDVVIVPKCRFELMQQTSLLYFPYVGDYNRVGVPEFEYDSWDVLEKWAEKNSLLGENREYWGIALDDADITDSNKCRFYAAISIDKTDSRLPVNSYIKQLNLPQGRYAVYTYMGDYNKLDAFYDAILTTISFEIDDSPILEHYINSPVDVRSKDLITEVWIPIVE